MALIILRCVFLAVAIALGFQLLNSNLLAGEHQWLPWIGFLGVMAVAAGVLAADMSIRRKRLDTITAVYFGMIIGLFLTYVFSFALGPCLPRRTTKLVDLAAARPGNDRLLHVHQRAAADQGRFPLHHSLRRVRQGSQRPQAVRARHERGHRRPHRRRRRDPHHRQPADHAAVRDRRAAGASPIPATSSAAAAAGAGSTSSTGSAATRRSTW